MNPSGDFPFHDENFAPDGQPRAVYRTLFRRLRDMPRDQVRSLDDQLEATMREMGVTFDITRKRPWGRRPWFCDLLPQIFTPEEWQPIALGLLQRLKAFEFLLRDIYSDKKILRDGIIPSPPVLGSAFFQRAASTLPAPADAYLHLSGIALTRLPDGSLAVKHHYFSNASGMSYMIQNRRALTRVIPQSFRDDGIHSISDTPVELLESLRSLSREKEPMTVLLSPGQLSPAYSEHSFLARRMGIPLVQGGDLLVLDNRVYLKTVSGLDKVDIIYTRVSDHWLDPLVFDRESLIGVPGLVQCVRNRTVAVVNAIGSQLADDRALLPFTRRIIRYYLGESPILPTLETYWMGDLDQRAIVLPQLHNFTIRPLYGERIVLGGNGRTPTREQLDAARAEILANPSRFVAQPQACDAQTISFQDGDQRRRRQDHIIFALRKPDGSHDVLPGALTRVSTTDSDFTSSELGGGSKDTWVRLGKHSPAEDWDASRHTEPTPQTHNVTSRVADASYWIGRYLERSFCVAGMVGVIESLELEELNSAERRHYRPVWNRILPLLENTRSRRNLASPAGRYRLTLDTSEPGAVVSTVLRAAENAESILQNLSLEAWGVISTLRAKFQHPRFAPDADEDLLTSTTRRLCEQTRRLVPQFFGTARATMLADDGWSFCEIGQFIERAAITANAAANAARPLIHPASDEPGDHATEIRLSAFLRLLNSRDAYRRVYQMRIEPLPLLELLWSNPVAPCSVLRCLNECSTRLRESFAASSPAADRALAEIENLTIAIRTTHWQSILDHPHPTHQRKETPLQTRSQHLLQRLLALHTVIADCFLNHQVLMHQETRPLFTT